MPNGSYSDGITTQPARCSSARSSSSGTNPASWTMSLTPSMSIWRLQLGEVAAAPGDDAADAGHPVAQVADRSGEHLEALLVLDATPGDDEGLALHLDVRRRRQPVTDVDAVGHEVDLLRWQLEPVDDLVDHEPRAGDDLAGPGR